MKLGDVLAKERKAKGMSVEEMASRLGVSESEYDRIERGESLAEEWGPRLAKIAIKLETPTSRLLAESGKAADAQEGQAGPLIARHRARRNVSIPELAELLGLSQEQYEEIERGTSPIEQVGPRLLRFAEAIEQPVFNLFYPCGLPFESLDDYP